MHQRNNRTGARSVFKTINHAKRSVIPECLPNAYDDDENDESEDELIEKRIRENFLSRHDSVFSIDGNRRADKNTANTIEKKTRDQYPFCAGAE